MSAFLTSDLGLFWRYPQARDESAQARVERLLDGGHIAAVEQVQRTPEVALPHLRVICCAGGMGLSATCISAASCLTRSTDSLLRPSPSSRPGNSSAKVLSASRLAGLLFSPTRNLKASITTSVPSARTAINAENKPSAPITSPNVSKPSATGASSRPVVISRVAALTGGGQVGGVGRAEGGSRIVQQRRCGPYCGRSRHKQSPG